jgi:hypothetical protein
MRISDPAGTQLLGGCVDLMNPAKVPGDVAADRAPVVGHGDGRDGADLLAPLQPALDQLPDRAGAVEHCREASLKAPTTKDCNRQIYLTKLLLLERL